MRLKVTPNDFVVTERADLRLAEAGPWAVYRVRKVGCTTLEVQTRLAAQLGLARRQVIFPALKDKEAMAVQFATLPAQAPPHLQGPGFEAQRVGYRATPLSPGDLQGNAFEIVVRHLLPFQAQAFGQALGSLGEWGLPNYFGAQRFGSYAPEWGFIGKAILQRDAQAALYAYLARPFLGDPPAVQSFKKQAQALWPDWAAMMAVAPKPSNYRSVLTFLKDHPQEYRKALNLIPPRLLSLYLAAYQSYLWNAIVAHFLGGIYRQAGLPSGTLRIAFATYPLHTAPLGDEWRFLKSLAVPLPSYRAAYAPEGLAESAGHVLAQEGLALGDLKARILKRAYLPRGSRALLAFPTEVRVEAPQEDEHFPGRQAVRVQFTLPSGSYATVVIQAAMALALGTR